MSKFLIWINGIRPRFIFGATVTSTVLGLALAFSAGFFDPLYAILTLMGCSIANAGVNVLNDYFDYKSGIDLKTPPTPFSGGSRVLPEGLVDAQSWYKFGLTLLMVAFAIGIFLALSRGWLVLPLILVAALSMYFYSQKISHWGLGEASVCLNFMLLVTGTYYVQVQRIDFAPVYVGLIQGIFIANILYINQFPDYYADRAGGRLHIPARLGKEKAVKGHTILFILAYLLTILGILLGIMPWISSIALISLPTATRATTISLRKFDKVAELIPAMALTILTAISYSFLLSTAYVVYRIFFP